MSYLAVVLIKTKTTMKKEFTGRIIGTVYDVVVKQGMGAALLGEEIDNIIEDYDIIKRSVDQNIHSFITEDKCVINPVNTDVYFYPTWATDGYPCRGLLEFDNDRRVWVNYHHSNVPVFYNRSAVDEYIKNR